MANTGLGDLLGGFIAKAETEIRLTISLAFYLKRGCVVVWLPANDPTMEHHLMSNNKS